MRIGIIGAMDEEVEILKDKIEDRHEESIAGCEFYTGTYEGIPIILLKSGIGKANAAMATTILIQKYTPDYVINTGSAGGFQSYMKVGDIVISNELRYHDADATVFGYEYGQIPGMPANYLPEERLISIAKNCGEELDVHVYTGLITSGDSFLSDGERVEQIKKQFDNKIYAAEMEAAAIAQVCYQFKMPYVIIRSLSDIAGSDAKMSYDQFLITASKNSADLVLLMLKEIDKID